MSRGTAVALALMLATAGSRAAEPMEVDWLVFGLPPLYILDGPLKGTGVLDRGLNQVILPRLTGLRHRVVEAPLKRIESTLKTQTNACVFGLLRNPAREAYMQFSLPFLPQLPPGLLVRRADAERLTPYLNGRGQVQLKALLDAGQLTVGHADGRSYGAAVDELLAPLRGRSQLQPVSATTPTRNLLQMLALQRIDAALMLPFEPRLLELTEGVDTHGLRFIPVAEQPREVLGHAACARSPEGERVIRQLNEILQQAEVQSALSGFYERWLDEDSRALARKLQTGH